ncbi:MAG: NAD-dependent malic enzyme [Gammaproteobacteria bacterium]|nr:NAD-dependent malic enzyme [Gammaproteobacteria bacterium]
MSGKPKVPSYFPTGVGLLHDPSLNKGTAFTEEERDALKLRGLLPPHVHTMEEQVMRVMGNFRRTPTPLEQHVNILGCQARNETLFYRVVIDHLEEVMPIIYTPTVGEACQKYGHIFMRPRGLFISAKDRKRIANVLRGWPHRDVHVIVVTDGERILGLGDLGADGMGIPVGKLALYTACGGVHPTHCLPVTLDVGTENEELLSDPLYIGLKQRRLRGAEYDEFIDEFIGAVQEVFPDALIQFEDFGNQNAFRLLQKYRDRVCTFNDDIQGTGAVVVAGLFAAPLITGGSLVDQTFLFLGAGEAGIGIGDMIVGAMRDEGLSEDEARSRCWFVDSHGLVVKSRQDLAAHKIPYAHDHPPADNFLGAVEAVRPTGIIGVSGQPATFTRAVLEAMARINERPIVFALSNPTSKSECTAEQAYQWTEGRAVFASGSPFDPVILGAQKFVPGQGNNAYIFPGVGLGVVVSGARLVTDEMFSAAAKALADQVSAEDLKVGRLYPRLSHIRDVSAHIGAAVATIAWKRDLATVPRPADVLEYVKSEMYQPDYKSYV